MRHVGTYRRSVWLALLAWPALAAGASAQSAGGVVLASATVLSPVSVGAPRSLRRSADGAGRLMLSGRLDVVSPAPHLVVGRMGLSMDGSAPSPLFRGTAGAVSRTVTVTEAPGDADGPVTIVYTVVVLL